MEEIGFVEWPEVVPWWVDAAADTEPPDLLLGPGVGFVLSVAEVLLEAAVVGPGPDAQRLLAALAGRDLDRDEWLTVVQLWEAQDAWLAGQRGLAVLGFAGPEPVTVVGFADDEALTLELALGVGCSEGFAAGQITSARLLSSTLVRTGDLLRAGRLSAYRARLIVGELAHLHPEVARRVEGQVLDSAATIGVGALRRKLTQKARRAQHRADRETANQRKIAELAQQSERAGRRVVFLPEAEDGLMGLFAYLPPVEAMTMQHTLETLAGPYRAADGRTQQEREADALIGTVIGFDPANPGHPAKPAVKVGVLIDLPTLLGLRDHDGELLGYGHLPAEVARELAADAAWQRMVYDPVDGHLLDAGGLIHRMPTALHDYLTLRDRHDRFPGGTRPAHRCDYDHTMAFKTPSRASKRRSPAAAEAAAAGPTVVSDSAPAPPASVDSDGGHTSANNLAALSRRHHRAKTFLGFSYHHLGGGTLQWTTPLGRTYTTRPHDYRPDHHTDSDTSGDSDPP